MRSLSPEQSTIIKAKTPFDEEFRAGDYSAIFYLISGFYSPIRILD